MLYHPNHPDGDDEMANQVIAFDPPRAIAWQPGQATGGDLRFGGWTWGYALAEHLENSLRHLAELAQA